MQDRLLAAATLLTCPVPRILFDGTLVAGVTLQFPALCRECQDRRCAKPHGAVVSNGVSFSTCHRGVGVAQFSLRQSVVIANGFVLAEQLGNLPRKLKKELAGQRIERSQIEDWYSRVVSLADSIRSEISNEVENRLGMLHDIHTSVSAILRSAEELVDNQGGGNFEENIEKLPPPTKRLVKAVQLLNAQLALMPLLTNPEAARYGQKHAAPVYKIVDRLVRIFTPVAERAHISISLRGSSYNRPPVYNSIETVPLVLIDNAIKYSRKGQPVEIEVRDVDRGGVRTEVRSFSPCIDPEDRARLFERGFRGKDVDRVATRGSGLGLYLAQTVASVHGFVISHESDDSKVLIDGIPYCNNRFSFTVRA
jgi:signal transduction histidine kinase